MLKKVEKSIFLPIIGISGRSYEDYIKINNNVIEAVKECGGIPIMIIPNDNIDNVLEMCDGIILPGGVEVTSTDKYICNYAIKNDVPILGICLGMQVMGSLEEDNLVKNITLHNGVIHKIKTIENTLINKIVGDTFVNSRHNEHITSSGKYKVSSYSLDGCIESIEYPLNRFNVGVQWHPEDMLNDKKQYSLIEEFINNCK